MSDRIYLNGYVPNLQVAGQVVSFMTAHLGNPIPSPAIMEKIGTAFRTAVDRFAADNNIPVMRFGKDDRKIEVMRPYLARQARTGRSGVAAIGIAQEFQNVFASAQRKGHSGVGWFSFFKADRRVTCFYFYLWDVDFGPAFIKICAYFPYPIKVWLNGHEWAKRQAAGAGIGFTELSNGFGTCPSPTTEKEASHTSFTGFDGRFSTVLDNAVPFAAGRGSRRLSALGAPGGGARRHLLRAGVRQELDTKPNEVDEDELRTAVST